MVLVATVLLLLGTPFVHPVRVVFVTVPVGTAFLKVLAAPILFVVGPDALPIVIASIAIVG